MDARKVKRVEKSMLPFPTRLLLLLRERGMTQEGLAGIIGKSRQAVSLYCNGTEPDHQTLCKIADALLCTPDYLLGREDAVTHDAASIVEQTGLSAEAVEVLKEYTFLLEDDSNNGFMYKAVLDFVSDLICSEHLGSISMRYLSWKDAIKEQIEEDEKYATDMAEYFDSHGCEINPIPKEKYIERDEKGEMVGYTIDFLEKAKEWSRQTLKYFKGEDAIDGVRYSIIRMFEDFLTEQSERGINVEENKE